MQPFQSLNNWSLNILYNKMNEINHYVKKYRQIAFVVLGDSHLIGGKVGINQYNLNSNGQQYQKILNHIVNNKKINPLFIIHGGDAVDAGNKTDSFNAFVQTTKSTLKDSNIPIFVSIGNHDYDRYNASSENFKFYIGPTRGVIHIPGTDIKYVFLNTHYSDTPMNNYKARFGKKDIALLLNESQIKNNNCHYVIDFHTPLGAFPFNQTTNSHLLSFQETCDFFYGIKHLNVMGIFCHHKHVSSSSYIKMNHSSNPISYIITGCGGNHQNNQDFSYYYVTIDTNNYKITSHTKYLVP